MTLTYNDTNEMIASFGTQAIMSSQLSVSSPTRSRMRMTPTPWTRLNSVTPEWPVLKVIEKPSLAILRMMLDMNRDDPTVASSATRMEQYENFMKNADGSMEVSYRQNDYSIDATTDYCGVKKIGRAYTNSALQRFPAKVVNTLFKRTHVEIDITSSYSSMLSQAFRHLSLPALTSYVEDSDSIYQGFNRDLGMSRDQVKKMINAMICSYPDVPGDYGLGFGNVDLLRDVVDHPFVYAMKKDLEKMGQDLQQSYPGFYDLCVKHGESNGNKRAEGLGFCFLASDMEHSVMRIVIENYYPVGPIEDLVWRFDGILLPESLIGNRSWEEESSSISNMIMDKIGIRTSFRIKSLQENSLGISISPSELMDTSGYGKWKKEFEKRWLILENPSCYLLKLSGRNNYMMNNDQGFKHNTGGNSPVFIKQWKDDPNRRKFEARTFMPPPMICPPNMFNTYNGIEADFIPENVVHVNIDIWLRHLDILVGNLYQDQCANSDYVHKWIAHVLQKPGEKTRTMIHIRSTPGVGKDVAGTILERMIGSSLVHRAGVLSDICGKSSVHQEGKILVIVSELSYSDSSPLMEKLKDIITSPSLKVNAKYIAEYSTVSCVNLITFSNSFGAMPVSADDRRMVVFTANGAHANKSAYFGPLLEFMKDQANIRALRDYYMGLDISGFDPVEHRPITEGYKEMVQNSTTNPMIGFFKKAIPIWMMNTSIANNNDYKKLPGDLLRIRVGLLWDDFTLHAQECGFKNLDSKNKLVQFGSKMMGELNGMTEKFLTAPNRKMIDAVKTNNVRFYKIDLAGWERFMESIFNENDVDGEEDEMGGSGYARGFVPSTRS